MVALIIDVIYRFYVFVCSMCNYGKEFVRRLELKWVDLVHLMLYNLTVYNAKKYYDLDTVIVPYANDNWNTLQLPPRVRCFIEFFEHLSSRCFYLVKNVHKLDT